MSALVLVEAKFVAPIRGQKEFFSDFSRGSPATEGQHKSASQLEGEILSELGPSICQRQFNERQISGKCQ